MKIALPIFRNRISPVFDWSTRLLVVQLEDKKEVRREERTLMDASFALRVEMLVEMGVETLLCGGISPLLASMLKSRGIRVYPWIAGEADEVLEAFLAGKIPSAEFAMPGCCRRQRRGRPSSGQGRGGQCGFKMPKSGRRRGE